MQDVQTDVEGNTREGTWVTDLDLMAAACELASRGGRARWKIENETFNTLKNQGYHFEHNYGHGYRHLAVVFATLMMLAFLVDQVQQKCNPLFRQAWAKKGSKRALWEALRQLMTDFVVETMVEIYEALAFGHQRPRLQPLIEEPTAWQAGIDSS